MFIFLQQDAKTPLKRNSPDLTGEEEKTSLNIQNVKTRKEERNAVKVDT